MLLNVGQETHYANISQYLGWFSFAEYDVSRWSLPSFVVNKEAIATHQRLSGVLRALRMPFGPPLEFARFDYLTDLIYTRYTWSHRMDICQATEREMNFSANHAGRMLAPVVRELAVKLDRELPEISVVYQSTGPAGGSWRVGPSPTALTPITMDPLAFIRLTSVRSGSLAQIDGDTATANRLLDYSTAPC